MEDKIEIVKKTIKIIKEDFGKKRCKEMVWGCGNCFGFLLLDMLKDYLGDLEWEQKRGGK